MTSPEHTLYWYWESAVDPAFCKYIVEKTDWTAATTGLIGDVKGNKLSQARKAGIVWEPPHAPISATLFLLMVAINKEANWNFLIEGAEDTQLTKYEQTGHYGWHQDTYLQSSDTQRKLTSVLLLNDASEFEGGTLELMGVDEFKGLNKAGSLIVFPSYLTHRVTPVTKGVRYTAVCWAIGPQFR